MTQSEAKKRIAELVEKYKKLTPAEIKRYSEEDTKNSFIVPLFRALGWDFGNRHEVSAEEHVKSSGFIDYGFYLNGRAKFYLEAKKLSSDAHKVEYADQAIRYAFNRVVTWAVLTDFEGLKVFNAQAVSKYLGDKLFFEIPFQQFVERFDQLWLLSRESFEADLIDKKAQESGKKLQKVSVTDTLFTDLNKSREILTKSLHRWNSDLSREDLDEGVQKLLDRLVFMRVAEDRKIEEAILRRLVREWNNRKDSKVSIYQSMVEKFRELDDVYNSNLFDEHPFEKWEEHDDATEKVIDILYGKPGYYDYDFKYIPADTLGTVYENYLGYQLAQSGKGVEVSKSARKRKEQGIYYTPTYIVDYIVTNALKPVLDKCESVQDLKNVKVLDPACGSGSFLIRAMDMIFQRYKELNTPGADFLIKDMILRENIFGVDLDEKAVEIARLNLLINALDSRVKLPPLDNNIKNGNSLISGTDEELEKTFGKNYRNRKPFNWEEKFPEVFKRKNPGFDVVIGNPPWGADIDADVSYLAAKYPASTQKHKDIYKIFIDLAISLLRNSGKLGFITPNTYLYQPRYEDIKSLINNYQNYAVNLGENIFVNVQLPCSILVLTKVAGQNVSVIDLTRISRSVLIAEVSNAKPGTKTASATEKFLVKDTGLTFDDVFWLKDAGIQYASVGAGKAGKGKSDLPKRIFQDHKDKVFSTPFYTGSNIARGGWVIDHKVRLWFRGNYKSILKENEWVHFTKQVFDSPKKIVWRQTADTLHAAIMDFRGYFGKTIHAGLIKEGYESKFSYEYALAIFNSSYIEFLYRQKVLETGKVFPQVKLKYLRELPFVVGSSKQQIEVVEQVKKMLQLQQELHGTTENSDKWLSLKSEIEKTDKQIDQYLYKLYNLTPKEIKIVEKPIS